MLISMLSYQADEYMKAVVGRYFEDNLELIRDMINLLCHPGDETRSHEPLRLGSETNGDTHDFDTPADKTNNGIGPTLADVKQVLSRFVNFVFAHPKVDQSPPSVRRSLRLELVAFLLAHVTQIEDNARFSRQKRRPNTPSFFQSPNGTYFNWVHTTSADHTSCPYSFAFFTCLISKPGQECFVTTKQKYLAQDLCRHLATMCRQYNDYGSIARDRAEQNLNSVDFPEFNPDETVSPGAADDERDSDDVEVTEARANKKKEDLLWLAEYERECLDVSFRRPESQVSAEVANALKLFIRVTDLYEQIYVMRDIASRTC